MLFEQHEFDLSDEDRLIVATVRDLVAREIAPIADRIDRDEEFPLEALRTLGEAGLVGLLVPEEHGGGGGSMLQYCLVLEEISRVSGAVGATYMTQVHGLLPVLAQGSEEQKGRWLPRTASADSITAIALTEPGAGSDVAGMRTRATQDGGRYRINGGKTFITNGNHADLVCVFARTSDDRYGGISIFAVEAGTPGFSTGAPFDKMGIRGSDTAELFFDDVLVDEEQRLGPEGCGFTTAMNALSETRLSTAAQATGLARGAFERAFEYAMERRQFDQPIYDFQAVQLKLMDMYSDVCAAKSMLLRVARLIDAQPERDHPVECSMVKVFASDVAMRVTTQAIDIFGGNGYMREYGVERFMRDAKITQIYDGTNDINRLAMARGLKRGHASSRGASAR